MEYKKAKELLKAYTCCTFSSMCDLCPFQNKEICQTIVFSEKLINEALEVIKNEDIIENNNLYMLKIYIDTDCEFGFIDDIYTNRSDEQVYFSTSRTKLCQLLVNSIYHVKNKFITHGVYSSNHIYNWYVMLNSKIKHICNKFDTFSIDKDFGGPVVKYELIKISNKSIDDIFTFHTDDVEMDFSLISLYDFDAHKYPNIFNDEYKPTKMNTDISNIKDDSFGNEGGEG